MADLPPLMLPATPTLRRTDGLSLWPRRPQGVSMSDPRLGALRPRSRTWTAAPEYHHLGQVWLHRGRRLRAISSLSHMFLPGTDEQEVGPTWHVSVSRSGLRCSDADLMLARRAFGLLDADEDNHHPGVARHLMMSVDLAYRIACECKTTEVTITEVDGYQWTNPTDGFCRGCWFEAWTGRPCPLHHGRGEHTVVCSPQ